MTRSSPAAVGCLGGLIARVNRTSDEKSTQLGGEQRASGALHELDQHGIGRELLAQRLLHEFQLLGVELAGEVARRLTDPPVQILIE